ncbi:unnamed protein product [Calypogeia fissa]
MVTPDEEALLSRADASDARAAASKISGVHGDYVALTGLPVDESESESCNPLWKSTSVHVLTCIALTLLLLGASISYVRWESTQGGGPGSLRGAEQDDDGAESDSQEYDNEFYTASRTGYHFQPEKNWMNDPNAPLFYLGYYHFFYQYNPYGVNLTDIHWGHAVSTDLVHWVHLEVAFSPDKWYDEDGVWSGSATILEDGTPAIIYTGAHNMSNDICDQTQNLALPVDPSDPLLRNWKKVDANPIVYSPVGIKPNDFRDPTTAWLEKDGHWRFAVGAKRDNDDGTIDGIALLYKSDDFVHWELEKHLHEGFNTGMWECVDFYPVSVQGQHSLDHSVLRAETFEDGYKYVLKAGLQVWEQDHYCIGTYSTETQTFTIDDPSLDIGKGYRYDYGKFYASKSFFDTSTGRRIVWGWANESDSIEDQAIKGWASVQAIPRVIWLDGMTSKNLLQWPVEELESLRGAKTSHRDIRLEPTDVIKVAGGDGNQLDVIIVFEKPDMTTVDAVPEAVDFDCGQGGSAHRGLFGPFGLLVHADAGLIEHTGVFFYISLLNNGEWATLACSDQSRSSLASGLDKTVYGSYVTVLPEEQELSLRILLDHSIVETFVQGGRFAITSRVYPTVAIGSRTRLFLFNNGTTTVNVKSLDVYQMNSVNMTTFYN